MSDRDFPAHDYIADDEDDEDEEPKVPQDSSDLRGEDADLDDTEEWNQTRAALEDVDAGDLDTDIDLDGPLSDYDALTDQELSATPVDPDQIDITEHDWPNLNDNGPLREALGANEELGGQDDGDASGDKV
jgi:hypothetical protein